MLNHLDLCILRHGETVWNRQGRFQDWKDFLLTEMGCQQALAQRNLLNAIHTPPPKVFVRPLGRAVETARLAVTYVDYLIFDDRLQELHFGEWEGATKQEINCSFDDSLWQFKSPGGETFEMISSRVLEFVTQLNEPAVVVTHGMTSRILWGDVWAYASQKRLSCP